MTSATTSQLDLLVAEDTSAPTGVFVNASLRQLGFALDYQDWLRFLVDEWWPTRLEKEGVRLGIDTAMGPLASAESSVLIWVDARRLPPLQVSIFGEGQWREDALANVKPADIAVHWPAPIPLSAVTTFSVSTEKDRLRLMAIAKGISNVGESPRPIEIRTIKPEGPTPNPPFAQLCCPPVHWNAMRGAAAMALWAVPSIDPWLDVFCESLSTGTTRKSTAGALGAPWLSSPPWLESADKPVTSSLWIASCEVFSAVEYRKSWRPTELLEAIVQRASTLGANDSSLTNFHHRTHRLLNDSETVDFKLGNIDPLGLAIQLVLLRPTAEHYVSWREESTSMPPVVWWTGAILSGLITGLRDLDAHQRGSSVSRELLAVRTWSLSAGADTAWPDTYSDRLTWAIRREKVEFLDGDKAWSDRKRSQRGDWFRANYADTETYSLALDLAKKLHPSSVRRNLHLSDTELTISGVGKVSLDKAGRRFKVKGEVAIDVSNVFSVEDLDVDEFRDWIAIGLVPERLPPVPESGMPVSPKSINAASMMEAPEVSHEAAMQLIRRQDDPPGLSMLTNFISPAEESAILRKIDASEWRNDLKRRVQHYGWRYDYRGRRIDHSAYLGDLPEWASELARRLVSLGLVNEVPDQVIVNEYIEMQGIGRHVDCVECFHGPIVTLSLGESWSMQFWNSARDRKIERLLERRSAVVLDGDVRSNWSHEIRGRKMEGKHVRGRRVSITFRKVIVDTSPARSSRGR